MLGAGAVGAAIGARLALAGVEVTLVTRPTRADRLRDGLTLSRWGGEQVRVGADRFTVATDSSALARVDWVLVTTKSRDTAAAAREAARHTHGGARFLSLQNGARNPAVLGQHLPGRTVVAGMIPFNLVWTDDGRLHQGTSGAVVVGPEAAEIAGALVRGGCEAKTHADVRGVIYGKLLLNLNNAVNALAGIPLAQQLADRDYRRIFARLVDEGRSVYRAAGIGARGVGLVHPALVPRVLRLPDALFFRIARAMVRVDPEARSSMADDLERGAPTEVDDLNGEIVRLAASAGTAAPDNATLVALVRAAEGSGSPRLSAIAIRSALDAGATAL